MGSPLKTVIMSVIGAGMPTLIPNIASRLAASFGSKGGSAAVDGDAWPADLRPAASLGRNSLTILIKLSSERTRSQTLASCSKTNGTARQSVGFHNTSQILAHNLKLCLQTMKIKTFIISLTKKLESWSEKDEALNTEVR